MFSNLLKKSKPALQTPAPAPQLTVITPQNAPEFERASDWELSEKEMRIASERRAWLLVIATVVLLILSWIVIVILTPLKKEVPYIVRVDNITGAVDVITVLADQRVGYDDVIDVHWLARYVRARETYDWNTLQGDYDETILLSSPEETRRYTALFEGENALDKVYGRRTRITIDVLSVVPNGKGQATVRYIKTIASAEDASSGKKSNHIATLGYEYRKISKLKAKERMMNPLGFWVTSYRSDEEFGTRPAPAPQVETSDEVEGEGEE